MAALRHAPSLSRASETLGVSRSALSHRIAELERQLGVSLVRQSGRRAVLTDDANALLAVMGDALDRIEEAVAPLRRRRQQLRISTVATFASHWLIPRLPDWQRRNPDIELAIFTTTRTIDLGNEDFDCAIRHGVGEWKGLASVLLFRETLVPVARANIKALSTTSTLIRARSRYRDWNRWWRACDQPGDPPARGMVVETRAQAMDAALAGAGIAMMDEAYAMPHFATGRLRKLGATVALPEGYHFTIPATQGVRAGPLKLLQEWLVGQASYQRDGINDRNDRLSHGEAR